MHPLPEFSYPSRSRVVPAFLLAGCVLAWLLALGGWWTAAGLASRPSDAWWVVLGLGAAWLGYGGWLLRRQPVGTLHWCVDHPREPGYWAWQEGAAGSAIPPDRSTRPRRTLSGLEWALDLQWAVLLRLEPEGEAARWVWCLEGAEPARWGALRRSLQYTRLQTTRQA